MKKTIIITEKQKEKIKSAMSQVHNKVNAACLDSIMVCEGENQKWTMYRGYKKEFGSQRNYLLWLTDDPSYAKEYGDTIDEFVIDGNKVNASIYTIDEYDNEFDYYDGPSQEATVEAIKDGVGGYCFYVNNDDTFCVCLWDNSAILSQRTLTPEEYDSIENQNLDEENIPSEYEIGYDVPGDPNSYAHIIKESLKSMLKDGVEKKLRATVKQMVKDGSLPTDYSLEMAEWYYNIIAKALNIKRDDVYDVIRKDDRYYYSIIDDEFEKCGGKYDLMDCENHRKGMKKDLDKLHSVHESKNINENGFAEHNLDFQVGKKHFQFQHGTTPHQELPDFTPQVPPMIMYKQFKMRLNPKTGENLAPGFVFPLYVNTEDMGTDFANNVQTLSKSQGLKIGTWYKSGEGACWLNLENGKCYTRGKGYGTDGRTIDILAYRPGWHLTTTPWGNQRGAKKVIGGLKGTGNNYTNTWDSEVWAKVEICVDVDATAKARSMSTKAVEQCLSHLEDGEFYKYKTNSNASDDQAWYIVDKIRIIDILDDDAVDDLNTKYYKDLSQKTGRQIHGDPLTYISKDNKLEKQSATRAVNSKTGEMDFVLPYWNMPRVNGKRYSSDDIKNMGYLSAEPTKINEGKPKSNVLDPRRVYTVLEFERILKANGYVCVNQVDSHRKYVNPNRPDRRPIMLVVHEKNSVLKVGATRDIILNYNLVPERVAKMALRENKEPEKPITEKYKKYLKDGFDFMCKNGYTTKPYPKIILDDSNQGDTILMKTGYFDPVRNCIVLKTHNRAIKDVMRTFFHECIHWKQQNNGTIEQSNYKGERIIDDENLMKLESEAYLQGNIAFRSWTETITSSTHEKRAQINESMNNENIYSTQFKAWFGDWENNSENSSKIVDKTGKPLPMYHGTKETFTAFSHNHLGHGGGAYLGIGFNFTSSDFTARGYGDNIHEVYLNIKHPLTNLNKTLSLEDVVNAVMYVDTHTTDIDGTLTTNYLGEPGKPTRNNVFKVAKMIYDHSDNDTEIYSEFGTGYCGDNDKAIIEVFEKLGFDGSVVYDNYNGNISTVVAFEPNQIKSISATNFNSGNDEFIDEHLINEAYTNQWGEQEEMMSIYYYPNPVEDEDDVPTYHVCGFDTSEQNFAKWNEDYDYDDLVRTFGQEVANDIENGVGTPTNYRYNNQPCKYINYDTTQNINIYDVNQVNAEAKKWFEVVDDVREADFILIDGTLLSVGRQTKGMDHANISRIGGIDKYQFVNLGNIRINSCGELSIDCGKMPTQEEIERLRELIATNRRGHSIIVDCGSSKSADYKDYEVDDIIPDIINYFNSGVWAKDKENGYFEHFLEEGITDISDLEILPCYDYYKDKGIREICHAIKDGNQQAIHYAGEKMANYVGPEDVLIPIPSRTGNAIQTLLLAKEIAKKSGSKIDNILNGKNRESLYNLKKQGTEPSDNFFGFHSNGTENTNLILVDNVLDTGMTVRAAANATGAKKVLVFAKTTENKILAEGLYEDLDPEDVDLSSFEIQDELNPKFWKDGVLDSRIRLRLLDIADDFVDSLDVNWVEPEDVIMTGSLANYNWNEEHSDIDLHIVIDFSKVDERTDFVKEYFDSKKKLWNEEHSELSIMGFPVEVYVQDANEEHTSSGIYSLDKNAWVVEPSSDNFNTSDFDDSLVREKVSQYANKIDEFIDSFKNNTDEYNLRTIYKRAAKVFKEIKNERKNGFEKGGGEYNTGNIIFKTLRRKGYIEKLQKLRIKIYNELRSLS